MPNVPTTPSQAATVPGAPLPEKQSLCEQALESRSAPIDGWDAWTIAMQGRVDEVAVTRLQQQITDALTGYDHIVVDLRDVSVLSTSAFALLCGALRRVHRPGARLVVADAAPAARRALELCELPGVELHPPTTPLLDPLGSIRCVAGAVTAQPDQQHLAA